MKKKAPRESESGEKDGKKIEASEDPATKHDRGTPLETVKHVLELAKLDPKPIEDETGFTVTFKDASAPNVTGTALVLEDDRRFLFYMELDQHAPPKTRAHVAEFITRANSGLSIGNFELDYSNGAVRFKTTVDYADSDLPSVFVRNAILDAMDGTETYGGALIEVIKGKKSPKEAIEEVEGSIETE